MYEEFYGFREKPFSKTPDPKFLYEGKKHREALARLQYAVEEREFMILTGEVGSGKTTLSRALLDSLDDRYQPVVIINPRLTPNQFIRVVANNLGINGTGLDRADLLEQIYQILYGLHEKDCHMVIIIDEAQLIPYKETFDEIRLLTNFQMDDMNLLSLVLIGQPELRKRLSAAYYGALMQRVGMQYHIAPLTLDETREYIDFRLKKAGRDAPLFSDSAVAMLYELSGGVPRRINNLAGCALLEGFGKERKEIDEAIIGYVAQELDFHS